MKELSGIFPKLIEAAVRRSVLQYLQKKTPVYHLIKNYWNLFLMKLQASHKASTLLFDISFSSKKCSINRKKVKNGKMFEKFLLLFDNILNNLIL